METGQIDPDQVMTPGILVDCSEQEVTTMDAKITIAGRAAQAV